MPAPLLQRNGSVDSSRVLVTGACGNLGRMVLHHLIDSLHVAPNRIVAGSRTPENLHEWMDLGVEARWLDFDDAASVEYAARGIDRVLLISTPDTPRRLSQHKTAVDAFVAAGVRHILYASFLNADQAAAVVAGDHRATEAYIRASGVRQITFLRNSVYFDNEAVWIAGTSHYCGKWYSACKNGRLAGIARDDAALAAATALVNDKTESQIYELSSTQALTIDEIVNNVGKAVGRRICAEYVPEEELVQGLVHSTGVSVAEARAFVAMDTHVAAGLAEARGNDFKKLTGRDPMTHAQWTDANRDELLYVA